MAIAQGGFDFASSHSHTDANEIVVAHLLFIGYDGEVVNLFLLIAIALGFVLYLRWASIPRFLRWLEARAVDNHPVWTNVSMRLQQVCKQYRIPVPALMVLPEFSPNALVLRSLGGRVYLVLTEGLVRSLSGEELDAALSLALSQSYQRGRRLHTRLAMALFPLARSLQKYPLPAQILFSPIFVCFLRIITGPAAFLKADKNAAQFQGAWQIAALLQKLSVMGRKIPLRRWNLAIDSLFLVSPLSLEETPLWAFWSQPPVGVRRGKLLESSACESAPSLS